MKIAIGFDHGGVALRDVVIQLLQQFGHEIVDFGTDSEAAVDYPVYAGKVAHAVASGQCDRGVLACGTGIGVSIAANKVVGCYAALANDCFSARMASEHNGANVLCLGARVIGPALARAILTEYLRAEPDMSARHQQRRDLLRGMEAGCTAGCQPDRATTDGVRGH